MPKPPTPTPSVTHVRLPPEVAERLTLLASRSGHPQSHIIRAAVEYHLDQTPATYFFNPTLRPVPAGIPSGFVDQLPLMPRVREALSASMADPAYAEIDPVRRAYYILDWLQKGFTLPIGRPSSAAKAEREALITSCRAGMEQIRGLASCVMGQPGYTYVELDPTGTEALNAALPDGWTPTEYVLDLIAKSKEVRATPVDQVWPTLINGTRDIPKDLVMDCFDGEPLLGNHSAFWGRLRFHYSSELDFIGATRLRMDYLCLQHWLNEGLRHAEKPGQKKLKDRLLAARHRIVQRVMNLNGGQLPSKLPPFMVERVGEHGKVVQTEWREPWLEGSDHEV